MDLEQLMARYAELRQELQAARQSPSRAFDRIDRLAAQLIDVERDIARLQPGDEQTSDALPSFAFTR